MKKKHLCIIAVVLSVILTFCQLPVHATDPEEEILSQSHSTIDSSSQTTPRTQSNLISSSQSSISGDGGVTYTVTGYETTGRNDVPNGIYAMQNLGNRGRWMDIQENRTTPGYHLQQYAYGESPADTYNLPGLFRITQAGTSNRYIIRLMINPCLSIGFYDHEVLTKEIPADDEDVAIEDTFYISYVNGGFLIRLYGTNQFICANDTMASGASGAPDSYLTTRSQMGTGDRGRWMLEGYNIPVPDGVYSFRSLAHTTRWLDIQYSSAEPGFHLQQYAYDDSPAALFDRAGLFKVKQVGNTGRYIIRLMLNNLLSFEFGDGEILTKEIPASDSAVSIYDTFRISYNNGGYIIRPYNQSDAVTAPDSLVYGEEYAPDSYLFPSTVEESGDSSRWFLERYTGNHCHGSTIYYPASWSNPGIKVGSTSSASCVTWSTVIGANTPYMEVSPETDTLASSVWNPTTKRMELNAYHTGTVIVRVCIRSATNTNVYIGNYSFTIVP